ncbi:MAG TPA: ABC transporter permease [Gaiellaceae bacterium]|nr:ABC transporter permease [Gaiellaceae bacterium]
MRLFRHELRGELLLYVRSRELAFFTFLLPMVFFVLLGSTYRHDRIKSEGNVHATNFLLAGMIGYGAIAIAFAGLAIVLVIRRESGVLKRLRATPLPAPAYIAALLTAFLAAFAVEVLALLVLGRLLFGIAFPGQPLSLVLTLLLGAVCFCGLGVAIGSLIRSAEGASAAVNAIYLPAAFLAGAFFSPHSFPAVLRWIADVLPLTYFLRIVRGIMLHGQPIWSYPGSIAALLAWGLVGLVVALRYFHWEPREQ